MSLSPHVLVTHCRRLARMGAPSTVEDTSADGGHHAVALARLRFDFASAPHRDALLDRKAIGRPAKIGLRCHCSDEAGTSGACRGIFFDAQRGCPHASIELAVIP